jgi:Ca2+-binding RTX toxin-like protein
LRAGILLLARTARLGAALFGAAMLLAPAAGAATVSVSGGTATFKAATREANDVKAGNIAIGGSDQLTIADANAPVAAGNGCVVRLGQATAGSAYGDSGDDDVILQGFYIPPTSPTILDGGSGDDTYTSSIGLAPIVAGSGIDTLDQRGTMETFSGFTFASCPGCYNRVIGTAQGDEITGDERSQIIVGSQGTDTLDGGPGQDVLDGGDDDDVLRARDGAVDVVRCGAGVDEVAADPFDVVARGCEAVSRAKLRR